MKINRLNEENTKAMYQQFEIKLDEPIVYKSKRDFLRSSVNVLLKKGYKLPGLNITMDSTIPIGKGMCSSSTMIVVLIKALLTAANHPDAEDPEKIANLAFVAEVEEFNEPGGKMDQFASALGGLVNMSFADGGFAFKRIEKQIPGNFILFDSEEQKDTVRVLSESKTPTMAALEQTGIDIRTYEDEDEHKMAVLDDYHKRKLKANISNYRILVEAKEMLAGEGFDPVAFGALIKRHHENLRDGLGISTTTIEKILDKAYESGALGGKINGSGGGGCCWVYCLEEDVDRIIKNSEYPCKILKIDTGVRMD